MRDRAAAWTRSTTAASERSSKQPAPNACASPVAIALTGSSAASVETSGAALMVGLLARHGDLGPRRACIGRAVVAGVVLAKSLGQTP